MHAETVVPESGEDDRPVLPSARRNLVLAAMCLALVLVVAGVSMLNVALPALTADLGASSSQQLWIVDGYAIALAALLLPFGALGDRYGRRLALIAGIALFAVASLASAFVDTPLQLILLRVVTGVAAALIMPGTLSTITNVFPAEERAKAVGLWAGFAGAGGMLGMLASGALLEQFWWGSVFVLNAVIGAVALVFTLIAVPNTSDPEHAHLDPVGSVLSVAAIGGLVLGILEGPHKGWSDPLTLSGLIIGGACLVGWVLWSLRTPTPLLDPRLFKLRGFSTGSASIFLQFFAMFGFFLVALQYIQLILGYSTFISALSLMPMVFVMLPLATVAASLAERYGMRVIGASGLALCAIGFGVLGTMSESSGYWYFLGALLIVGTGVALATTPATNAIVGSLPPAKQGVASAVNDTARELGAAFGIAVLGSAFNSGYRSGIDDAALSLPPDVVETAREAPGAALAVGEQLGAGGVQLVEVARDAFMTGLRYSVLIGAGLLVVGALFVWLRSPAVVRVMEEDDDDEGLGIIAAAGLAPATVRVDG